MSSLFDLTGRTALVTGSSRGIGNALARALADAGATVVLNGINEERLKAAEATMAADSHLAGSTAALSTSRRIRKQPRPCRCIARELRGVENNPNISNMGWEEFGESTDDDGVFRSFS